MSFAHNASVDANSIDDDYISSSLNAVEIPSTLLVENGQFIRLKNDDYSFFGVVTEVSPGEYTTKVGFKSFLTIFDEDVLLDTNWQGTDSPSSRPTLETVIYNFLNDTYVTTSDTYQRLPISVTIDPTITQTVKWSFGIRPDRESTQDERERLHYSVVNLYSDIIVRALKEYGVAINVQPIFHDRTIQLTIIKRTVPFDISADLDNVIVKTLKYSDKNIGTNKLIVYNAENFSQNLIFYVHTDRSWNTENRDRITPVVRAIKTTSPKDDSANGFAEAATETAYSELASSSWDNCIELETFVDDPNVTPMELYIGQTVTVHYKEGRYSSILTGRILDGNKITLIFGSDRIKYTKRFKLNGGK